MSGAQSLHVRRREPADLRELGKVLLRVHQVDGYPVEGVADLEGWLQPPGEIAAWTAVLGDRPIGQVSLAEGQMDDDAVRVWMSETGGALGDIAVVMRLFVDPDYRGVGGGRELMRAAREHASAIGKRLVFDVMLKDERAIGLYEALGCQRLAVITHHHSDGLQEPAAVYVAPE